MMKVIDVPWAKEDIQKRFMGLYFPAGRKIKRNIRDYWAKEKSAAEYTQEFAFWFSQPFMTVCDIFWRSFE